MSDEIIIFNCRCVHENHFFLWTHLNYKCLLHSCKEHIFRLSSTIYRRIFYKVLCFIQQIFYKIKREKMIITVSITITHLFSQFSANPPNKVGLTIPKIVQCTNLINCVFLTVYHIFPSFFTPICR